MSADKQHALHRINTAIRKIEKRPAPIAPHHFTLFRRSFLLNKSRLFGLFIASFGNLTLFHGFTVHHQAAF